jgi:lambda family phage tail tape measure protein
MASSIKVAIEVDNKKYIADIKLADATTQKFGTNAVKSLNSINLVSNNLISRLGGLKSALAGLVGATAIQSANNFANAVKDIATTADISIETILGLGRAFELNGGSAEGAQQAILKFADNIAQARSGNDSALKSFREVGISIDDLNKNGIEELAKKSIAGIAGLSSATAQIRTQTDLFGKSAKGVSFSGVQQTQGNQFISAETVAALKSGADASENLKRQFSNLTEALLLVAKPLNDIVKDINITATAFASLIKVIAGAIAVFALFKGVAVVSALLAGLSTAAAATGGVIAAFGTQFVIVANSIKYFALNMARAVGLLPTAFGGLTSVGFALGALIKGFLRFAGVIGIIYTVIQAIDFLGQTLLNFSPVEYLTEKFNALLKVAREFFGLKPSEAPGAGAGRGGNAETLKQQQEQGDKMKKAWDEQQAAIAATKERYAKLNAEINKTSTAFKNASQESRKLIEDQIELVGKTKEEVEMAGALEDVYLRIRTATQGLIEKRKEWSTGTEDQRANVGLITAQIKLIEELGAKEVERVRSTMTALQSAKMLEEDRLRNIENMTKAMEAQLKIQEALSGAKLSIISQGQDTAFAGSQIGKGDLQKQFADIAEANRKAGLEASRAFAAAFEDGGDGLTMEQAQQLADGLKAIEEGYAGITASQNANLELSRTWATGWDEAFANYRDSAQNAADSARTYFTTFTSGVEDAIVNFVKTGKLSFKDLANSLIAEFTKSQVKNILASLFGGGGSGGSNIFGTIAGFFGFGGGKASGGSVFPGKSYMVGEKGPELFSPRGAGVITPNAALGGGVVNTNVVYNISAVDAGSFKALVASDPEFIYGVSERGRRNLPLRSRL